MTYRTTQPMFPEEDIAAMLEEFRTILSGGGVLTRGPRVREFETQFAAYVGTAQAVAVNSCTSALEIALRALGVGPGDEVIVPVQTFVATASAAASVGATVVFCDTDETFSLSVADLQRNITPATKAVITVHFAGLVHPEIVAMRSILGRRGIALIEDAAHATGAALHGVRAGAFGTAGCFSFFATKIMTTGEGGMITTDDAAFAQRCRSLTHIGRDVATEREQYVAIGGNRRMTELQAILGLSQLRRLDAFVAHRNVIARTYRAALASCTQRGALAFPVVPATARHAYWKFIVLLADGIDRARVREKMEARGISVDWPYEPLVHLQPVFRGHRDAHEGAAPCAEALARRHVCLPIHLGITTDDARSIAQTFLEVLDAEHVTA